MRDSAKTVRMQGEFERLCAWDYASDCGAAYRKRRRAYSVSGHLPTFYDPFTQANSRYTGKCFSRIKTEAGSNAFGHADTGCLRGLMGRWKNLPQSRCKLSTRVNEQRFARDRLVCDRRWGEENSSRPVRIVFSLIRFFKKGT